MGSATNESRALSPGELGARAARLYRLSGLGRRALARWRPRICPLHRVVAHVAPGGDALDVGCAQGALALLLLDLGAARRVTGLDIDEGALASARDAAAKSGLADSARFVRLDGAFAWPEGDRDLVLMIDVLHHVPPSERRAFFARAARALRPGGRLVYKDMCDAPAWRRWANRLHDLVMARQLIHEEPIERVESWAAEEGLTLTATENISMLWYGHELRVFESPTSEERCGAGVSDGP